MKTKSIEFSNGYENHQLLIIIPIVYTRHSCTYNLSVYFNKLRKFLGSNRTRDRFLVQLKDQVIVKLKNSGDELERLDCVCIDFCF